VGHNEMLPCAGCPPAVMEPATNSAQVKRMSLISCSPRPLAIIAWLPTPLGEGT
jgi:hypothetical protein